VSLATRVRLGLTIVAMALRVAVELRLRPLPDVVARLASRPAPTLAAMSPRTLSRAVDRVLTIGPFEARCVIKALVLFHLLRGRDLSCDLVIGLPDRPSDKDAHAWIEIGGYDVGPSPGRMGLQELVRYP
jgi:hypothetical protein